MKKVIEIRSLNYIYPDGTQALNGIDMDIYKGDSLAIIGANGAGKTTLLLHLNGLLNTNGSVRVCGLVVDKRNLAAVRQKVGFLFQDPDDQLFMPSVFDDVAFGPINMGLGSRDVKERVKEALRFVDMKDYEERAGHHLSFGEKKRISLATILSMQPEILVLDEPTGNLDPKYRKEFIVLLKGMQVTKIIATHDIDMAKSICTKVAIMEKGRIIAFGDKDSIFHNKKLIKVHGLD